LGKIGSLEDIYKREGEQMMGLYCIREASASILLQKREKSTKKYVCYSSSSAVVEETGGGKRWLGESSGSNHQKLLFEEGRALDLFISLLEPS